MRKYRSKDGNHKITSDSTGEGLRYKELKFLEKTGRITDIS